jgi:hypothetical protein
MDNIKSTPILDGAYEVIGIVPGKVGCPLGEVDLSRLTPELAEKLIAIKLPYLRRVEAKPKVKKVRSRK